MFTDELDPAAVANRDAINRRVWVVSVWCWPVCLLLFGVCFAVVAGFFPPPRESWTAEHIARFYADNRTGIRIGLIGALMSSALMLPWFNVVSREIREIEGRHPLLAPLQFGGAVILICFFQIICLMWLLASFRPESSPDVIRAFNDYGWLVWTMLIPTYSGQFLCMAVAGFMDPRRTPLWPRWAAWANFWVALTGGGGVLAVFFKDGPFSWNGIIGLYIPVTTFVLGMGMNTVLLLAHGRRQAVAGVEAAAVRVPVAA